MRSREKNIAHRGGSAGRALAWQIQRAERGHYDVVDKGKIALEFGIFFPKDIGELLNRQWYYLIDVLRLSLCLLSGFG